MKEVLASRFSRNQGGHGRLTSYPGIDVVRNRIKGFAQKKVTLSPGRHKIVILDEADRYAMQFQSPITLLIMSTRLL